MIGKILGKRGTRQNGPTVRVAAFGKHPAWNDHVEDIGLESEPLVDLRRNLYVEGIGGGVVGTHAAKIAVGMGADVTVFDRSLPRLRYLDDVFGGAFKTAYSSAANIAEAIAQADMVIGAVLIPGAAAPKLVSRAQLKTMKPGSVLVDVAIDQGGCFETSHATTHQDPIYEVDGVLHYCVANMPGAVARTSTLALGNATLPFLMALANKGWKRACAEDEHLLNGLNVHAGKLTYAAVGAALNLPVIPAREALSL